MERSEIDSEDVNVPAQEVVFFILKLLGGDENFVKTVHSLEQESGLYFNIKYFESQFLNGEWDVVESYLSGFTKVEENIHSREAFFEIRKQKYIEALDRHDIAKAVEILRKDLKVFESSDEDHYKEIALLCTLDDFRDNAKFSHYKDMASVRSEKFLHLEKMIKANPLICNKLTFPRCELSRFKTFVNRSLLKDMNTIDTALPSSLPDSLLEVNTSTNPSLLGAHPRARVDTHGGPSERCKTNFMQTIEDLEVLLLPDPSATGEVVQLLYANSGNSVLALSSTATHKLWTYETNDQNLSEQLWKFYTEEVLTNDASNINLDQEPAASTALNKNGNCVVSASGGMVSLISMTNFKVLNTFMPPPPAATCLSFYPNDSNIIAIGMEDSSILIYHVGNNEVLKKLEGHKKQITGLAFSETLNVLVSSDAAAKLFKWDTIEWKEKSSRSVPSPKGRSCSLVRKTSVQFRNDQNNILVVEDGQISVYNSDLECLHAWILGEELPARILNAVYSCDGLLVYAGFRDGTVSMLDSDGLFLHLASIAHLPQLVNRPVYPTVIAAHPTEPNQFAIGMNDGTVCVAKVVSSPPLP